MLDQGSWNHPGTVVVAKKCGYCGQCPATDSYIVNQEGWNRAGTINHKCICHILGTQNRVFQLALPRLCSDSGYCMNQTDAELIGHCFCQSRYMLFIPVVWGNIGNTLQSAKIMHTMFQHRDKFNHNRIRIHPVIFFLMYDMITKSSIIYFAQGESK